ncbi:hypothetical protein IE81DRAFT_109027 [Ceraceosorus guamensis]|uniref:Enoyl reductase (ER) domain-containing protein n=1 Tax=Ceraceosorus guamensis TaxID=1522189 RepID=A0A316W5T9_9BASI|nr:hypothetical protein IE81DRAFT_109027 [Ceraceosorus guamensis]PWN43025.1 hypothetical protein IE81DRAFT_109027 [Ceraceosorus guamensis]
MGRRSMLDSILNRPSQSYTAPDPNLTSSSRSKTPRGWQAPSDLPNAPNAPSSILSGSMFSKGTLGRTKGASVGGSVTGGSLRFGRKKKNSIIDDGASSIAPPSTVADSVTGERRRSRWWEGSLRGLGKSGGSRAPSIAGESIFSEPAEPPSGRAAGWAGVGAGATDSSRRRHGTFSEYGEPSGSRSRMASPSPVPPLPQHDLSALRAMNGNTSLAQSGRLATQGVAPLGQSDPALARSRSPPPPSQSGSVRSSSAKRDGKRLSTASSPDLQAQAARQRQSSKGQDASQDWSAFIASMNGPQNVNGRVQSFAVAASASSAKDAKVQRRRSAAERVRRELEQDALADQASRDPGVVHQDLLARAAAQVIGQSAPLQSGAEPVDQQGMQSYAGLRPGSVIGEASESRPVSSLATSHPPARPEAAHTQPLDQHAWAVQQHAAALNAVAPSNGSVHTLAVQQHLQSHAQAVAQPAPASSVVPQTPAAVQPPRPASSASLHRDLPPSPSAAQGQDDESESSGEESQSGTESEESDETAPRQVPMLDALVEEDEDSSSAGGHEMRPRSPPVPQARHSAFAAALKKSNVAGTNVAAEVNQQATSVTPAISVEDVPNQALLKDHRPIAEITREETDSDSEESLSEEGPITQGPLASTASAESVAPSLPPKPSQERSAEVAPAKQSDSDRKAESDAEDSDTTDSEAASRKSSGASGPASRASSIRPSTLPRRLSDLSLGASFAISNMLRGSRAPSQASSSRRMRMRDGDSDSAGERSEDDAELRAKAQLELERLRSIKVGDDFFGDSLAGMLDTFDRRNWSDTTIDRLGLDASAKQQEAARTGNTNRSSIIQNSGKGSNAESSVHERLIQIRQQRAELSQTAAGNVAETKSLESGIAPSFAAAWLLNQADDKSVRSRADLLASTHNSHSASHARQASAASAGTLDSVGSPAEQYKSLFAGSAWQSEASSAAAKPPVSILDRPRPRGAKPSDMGGVEIRQGRLEADSPAKASPPPEDTRSTLPASLSAALFKTPPREGSLAESSSADDSATTMTPADTKSKDKPAPAKSALKPKPSKSLADTLFNFGSPGKDEKREKKSRRGGASKATFANDDKDDFKNDEAQEASKAPPSAWAKKERKIAKAERKAQLAQGTGNVQSSEPFRGDSLANPAPGKVQGSNQHPDPLERSTDLDLSPQRPDALYRVSSGLTSPGGSSTDGFESANEFVTPDVTPREDPLNRAAFLTLPKLAVATSVDGLPASQASPPLPSATSAYLDAPESPLAPHTLPSLASTLKFTTAPDLSALNDDQSSKPSAGAASLSPSREHSVQSADIPAPASAPLATPALRRETVGDSPMEDLWSGESALSTNISTPSASDVLVSHAPLFDQRAPALNKGKGKEVEPALESQAVPSSQPAAVVDKDGALSKRLPMPPVPSFENAVASENLPDDTTPLAVNRPEPTFGSRTPQAREQSEPHYVNLIPPTPPALESRPSFGASRPPATEPLAEDNDTAEEVGRPGVLRRSSSTKSTSRKRSSIAASEPGEGTAGSSYTLARSASTSTKRPVSYQVYTGKGLSLPPGLVATTVASSARRTSSVPVASSDVPHATSAEAAPLVERKKSSKKAGKEKSSLRKAKTAAPDAPPVPKIPTLPSAPGSVRDEDVLSSVGTHTESNAGSQLSASRSASPSGSPSPAPSISAPGSVVSSAAGSAVSDGSYSRLYAPHPRKIRTLSAGPSGQARTAVMSAINEWESSPISEYAVPSPLQNDASPTSLNPVGAYGRGPSPVPVSVGPSSGHASVYNSVPASMASRSNSSIVIGATPALVRSAPIGAATDAYLPVPRSRLSMDGASSPVHFGDRRGSASPATQSVDGHGRYYPESAASRESGWSASQSAMSLPAVPTASYRPKDPLRSQNTIDDRLYARTTMNTVSVASGAFMQEAKSQSKRRSIDAPAGPLAGSGAPRTSSEVPEHLQDELGQTTMALSSHTPPPRKLTSTQVLCQVIAVAIDEFDRTVLREKVRNGSAYGFVPGRSFSGRVMETGWEVKKVRRGDVVFGLQTAKKSGALAEFMVIEQNLIAKAPEDCLTTEQIAALPATGVMSYQLMQNHCSQVPRGARILILNAHDGIGLLTMQECAPLGLIVVAQCPASVSDGVAVCEANGAHEVVIGEPLWAINSLHESSFDLVVDTVGGRRIYDAARRILANGGQFTTCFGDEHTSANPNLRSHLRSLRRSFFKKDRKNIGYEWLGTDQGEDCQEALEAVRVAAQRGDVCPRLRSILPFADAPRAFDPVIRGVEEEPGAVVVRVS